MRHWVLGLACLLAGLLAGCGSGGNTNNTPSDTGETGTLAVEVAWPSRTRVMPAAADSMVVALQRNGAVLATRTLDRVGDEATTAEMLFPNLPTGAIRYTLTAYAERQGGGAVLGVAEGMIQVHANASTRLQASAMISSAVDRLIIRSMGWGPTFYLHPGGNMDYLVTALNAQGQVLPLGPHNLFWQISDPTLATVDADTGAVFANPNRFGTAELRVTERESGVIATVPFAVRQIVPGVTAPFTARRGVPVQFFLVMWDIPDQAVQEVRASWDWEGDGLYDETFVNVPRVNHTYPAAGWYTPRIRVQVWDRTEYDEYLCNPILITAE